MTGRKNLFVKGLLLVGLIGGLTGISNAENNTQFPLPIPVVHVPVLKKAPVMDGVIGKDEWKGATKITGFMSYGTRCLMPENLQPEWYLGWDDKNLYIASRYVLYPKGTIIASEKEGDKGGSKPTAGDRILQDDHVELQFATIEDRKAIVQDHFYKLIINAHGAVSDQRDCHSVGWDGFEWESNAKVGSKVYEDHWDLELAIPFISLGYKGAPKDLTKIYTQLVSAADSELFYAAWVPYAWLSWQYFPELILDRNAPAIQIKLGAPEKGNLDVAVDLNNESGKEGDFKVQLKVRNGNDKEIFERTDDVKLASGNSKKLEFKSEKLDITIPKGNTWEGFLRNVPVNMMQITVKDSKGKLLFRNDYRYTKTPTDIQENFLKPFAMRRQVSGDPIVYSAYMPYYNKLEVFADTAILGMAKEYKEAVKVNVTLENMLWKHRQHVAKGAGMVFAEKTVPVDKSGVTKFTVEVPELQEGQYIVITRLLDKKGKTLFAQKEPFRRYKFAWEHNKIATTTEAIPPFDPIKVKNDSLTLWNREYTFGNSGLLKSVISKGEEVLNGEPRLTAIIDGKEYTLKPEGKVKLDAKSTGLVLGTGQGTLGPLKVEISSRTEYDGLSMFNLKLIPQGKVKVDDITLKISMPEKIAKDFFIMGPATDPYSNVGAVAKKDGIFWNSLNLKGAGNIIGKFIPYIYLGDGEKGLCYVTNSDKGRILDINKDADYLERKGSDVDLVIKIANTSRIIDKPRTFTFGLEAVPVKPMPEGYRKAGYSYRSLHRKLPKIRLKNGYGGSNLSCWGLGPGTDCLTVRDELEYKILRDQVLAAKRGAYSDEYNVKVIKYIPTNTMGLKMKEFETFSGEWSGKTYIKPHPHPGYNKLESPFGFLDAKGGTRQYSDMTQSNVDMRVWAFDQLQKQCGLNGFWWDHGQFWSSGNLNKGTAFLKDDGTKQGILNIFLFRQLMKRLAVVSYENALPFRMGQYAPGIMPTMGFGTYNWAVEGAWYCKPNKDIFVNFNNDLNRFRALCGRWSGLPTIISSLVQEKKGEYPFQSRSAIGLALLHDTQLDRADYTTLRKTGEILEKVDFFDNRTEWVPYWRSSELVETGNPKLIATVYLNKHDYDGKKAMIVLFNAGDKEMTANLKLNGELLAGSKSIKLIDMENDKAVNADSVKVKSHDYRLLMVK